jgi:predicted regulator of amino acid metabolism with ACT domain
MKKNNVSQFFENWTTKKLKDYAKQLNNSIYVVECYGSTDLRLYNAVLNELNNRGIEIQQEIIFN